MEPAIYCIENTEAGFVTRIGAYKTAATARQGLRARGKGEDVRFVPVAMFTEAQISKLRAIVDQHRSMADVAQRLDASISWLRDGKSIGVGIGLADMIALRALLRSMQDA